MTIAGIPFTLTQEGAACSATIKPRSYEVGRGPDDILIAVTSECRVLVDSREHRLLGDDRRRRDWKPAAAASDCWCSQTAGPQDRSRRPSRGSRSISVSSVRSNFCLARTRRGKISGVALLHG